MTSVCIGAKCLCMVTLLFCVQPFIVFFQFSFVFV